MTVIVATRGPPPDRTTISAALQRNRSNATYHVPWEVLVSHLTRSTAVLVEHVHTEVPHA